MNKIHIILGIDPGEHGGIAAWFEEEQKMVTFKMPETFPGIYNLLRSLATNSFVTCYLEDVGKGVPGQSSSATAKFARHNGHIEMALYALGISTEKVTPQKWQKFYSNQVGKSTGLSKTEWKNKLKTVAQMLYPSIEKITLDVSDAILIAHYGKQK